MGIANFKIIWGVMCKYIVVHSKVSFVTRFGDCLCVQWKVREGIFGRRGKKTLKRLNVGET